MVYQFDAFALDDARYELRHDGQLLHVEPLVFDLIAYVVCHPDRIIRRDELVDAVWGGRAVSEATISSALKSARKALGENNSKAQLLETVRGRGIRFAGDVDVTDEQNKATSARNQTSLVEGPDASEPEQEPGQRGSGKPLLAVLPFENSSVEFDDYFAIGLTEDISTHLARFRELRVLGHCSTARFHGANVDLAGLRRAFNVDYIVQGRVRRAAGLIRITAKLVEVESGVQIWADNYDGDMADIFTFQDDVTRTVAATLGANVQGAALQRTLRKNPDQLDAYECVLRARRYTWILNAKTHAEARDLLEMAVRKDSASADAHALLANVYLAEHRFDTNPLPDPIGRALAMAERAIELDPQCAYARCWLAIVHFFRHRNDKFRAEAERALALNPNDAETLADLGHYFSFMGEFERGAELSKRACALNPLHPGWYHFSLARGEYNKRNYEAVVAHLEKIALPHFYWWHMFSAAVKGQIGDRDALDHARRMMELKPELDPARELSKWNAADADREHFLEGLAKAAALRQ